MDITVKPIILAAGEGKRMGKPKLFCAYRDKFFLQMITDSLPEGLLPPVVVIRSEYKEAAEKIFPFINQWGINPDPEKGMLSSIICGITYQKAEYYFIIPVDFPFVKKSTYQKLLQECFRNKTSVIKPSFQGKRGHPIIIPSVLINRITPKDSTLKDIINNSELKKITVDTDDAEILNNINGQVDFINL